MNFNYNPANLYGPGLLGDADPGGRGEYGGGGSGIGYTDSGPIDEFGLPDLGSLGRKRAEADPTEDSSRGWGKEYGYPHSSLSFGDGFDSGPAPFLPNTIKDSQEAEYYPGTANARGASPYALVAPLVRANGGNGIPTGTSVAAGFHGPSPEGIGTRYNQGYGTPQDPLPAETLYSRQRGPNRLEGGNYGAGPMLNTAGMGSEGFSAEKSSGKHSRKSRKSTKSSREGFAVSGDRGTAPYPQARSKVFDTREVLRDPRKPVEYYQGHSRDAPNPRSKDYVFSNKHGKLSMPAGVSLTSGTSITADSDYLVGNYRDGAPVSSYWAGAPSAFSSGAVGLGVESVGDQYGGSMLHHENNTFNGFTKNTTTRCVDHVGAVHGVYMGPPEPNVDGVDIGGPPPPAGLKVPDMFRAPNKTMDDYFTNIAYIKDNPQIVEFYGANVFELTADGTYGGTRPSTISATSKRNIVGEHFDDRIVDLRFGNGTPYQYALANSPGSTSRGVYLDMITVKAMRPVLDYIFYLETGGAILPDQTDEFYFVTEEQYFSTSPLNKDLVHYCSKRYNTGMIDVFKFLNYVFQYFFKRDSMVTADFRTYSKLIDRFVANHYSR